MNREIKFRAKRLDNGEWIYGNYCQSMASLNAIQELDYYGDCDGKLFEIDRETLGQYTGLKDKNGNEIYEGDIVIDDINCFRPIYQIGYDNGGFAKSNIQCKKPCWYGLNDTEWGLLDFDCIIIGNIYDNPELLKKKDNR